MANQNDSQSRKAAGSTTAAVKATAPGPDFEALLPVILERPLFSPTRHLPEAASGANIGETSQNAPQQLHGRLAGITIRPGVREALFVREGQKPIAVNVGGEIEGWRIAAIDFDRVILSSGFGDQTVKPANDPQAVRPPAQAINMGFGMGPPAISSAPVADARGNPSNGAAQVRPPAAPNMMRNPSRAVARTGRPGRK
jgi:hypothetical protein